MKELEQNLRGIEMEGLTWGASKLVPLAFGIKKLQINLVVEDEKVSIDDLQQQIEGDEDHVQSTDVVRKRSSTYDIRLIIALPSGRYAKIVDRICIPGQASASFHKRLDEGELCMHANEDQQGHSHVRELRSQVWHYIRYHCGSLSF